MATRKEARHKQEQGMLSNIGARDEPAPKPAAPSETAPSAAAPSAAAPIGWMEYVGGVLWATVFCGAGFAAWLYFTNGG